MMGDQLTSEAVTKALEPVQQILNLDGAEVEFVGIGNDRVDLRLVLEESSCADCVMPKEHLEEMILMSLRESLSQVSEVRLHDPRM